MLLFHSRAKRASAKVSCPLLFSYSQLVFIYSALLFIYSGLLPHPSVQNGTSGRLIFKISMVGFVLQKY
jgi:hypothetical protein